MNIETEIKVELPDYQSYIKIYNSLGLPEKYLSQENIYFDTADQLLHRLGVMFRLRIENGEYIFTVKSGSTLIAGVQKAIEKELYVPAVNCSIDYLQKTLKDLCTVEFPPEILLHKIGSMLNKRVVYNNFFGAELELDHMQIFDDHFFEIEIETTNIDLYQLKIKELLQQNQIDYQPSCSKYSRFLKLLMLKQSLKSV